MMAHTMATQPTPISALYRRLVNLQAEFNTSEHTLYARDGVPDALHELNAIGYQLERVRRQISALRTAEPLCEVAQ